MSKLYGEEINLEFYKLNSKTKKLINNFKCGNEDIDEYFSKNSLDDNDTTSFIYYDRSSKETIAVYSLSCSGIIVEDHKKIFLYPAVEIKFFAVNENYHHMQYSNENEKETLSDYIFDNVLYKICDFTEEHCGASRVVLYSVSKAINFYKKHGFKNFERLMHGDDKRYLKGCTPLFLSLV